MNILMLTDYMDRGGAETHVFTLSNELAAKDHRVTVASEDGSLARRLRKSGVRHLRLPLGSHSPLDMLLCRAVLRSLIKEENFDVVHSHSRLASLLVSDIAKKQNVPLVCTVHAHFKITPLRRRLSRWGDSTISVSEDLKQYLVDQYAIAPENISVIPNGVDVRRFYPSERSDIHLRIAFLSRLDDDCSLGAILLCQIAPRLCAAYPDLDIAIGGGGSELSHIKFLACKANGIIGRKAIKCVGNVCDVPSFMRSCDILIGVSRVAIEGGLCGASVVLCGNEGFFGEITEGNFSRALATNFCARGSQKPTSAALYDSLTRLLSLSGQERKISAQGVRKLLLKNCSSSVCAKKVLLFYKSLYKNQSKGNGGTLLCGYYGFGNMGDDALLRASIERARIEYPNEPIKALSKNGSKDSKNFSIPCACRYSPISVLWQLAHCRRLVFGGGTLLQCNTSKRSMLYYASLLLLAKAMGRERILWANGIGQIDGRLCQAVLKNALSDSQKIEVRDTRSFKILKQTLPDEEILLTNDLAKSKKNRYSTPDRAEYLLSCAKIDKSSRFVIAIPRARGNIDAIRKLVVELKECQKNGNDILIISMYDRQDLALCKQLCALLKAKTVTGICFDDLRFLAESSQGVYSMRYHGLVAAHLAGVDFTGVGNDRRLSDYCSDNGGKVL